ncbi:hypothetical protein N7463_003295 [Penicillium fimorum]|uniref:Uncharacterized protein n=1 Tax=Penicillium fimorum TaxID=1882269 RepID=A0A9W9Y0W0_9EURO|nr:hypothetical protein N7463_003295 [Penicillium fimorum]
MGVMELSGVDVHGLSTDGIPASLIADGFRPELLSLRRWSLITIYVSLMLSLGILNPFPDVPIIILVEQKPSDNLLRAEVLTIAAVIITRLEGEETPECSTIPQ